MAGQSASEQTIDRAHILTATKYALSAYVAGIAITAILLAVFLDGFKFDPTTIGATFYGAHNVTTGQSFYNFNVLKLVARQYPFLSVLWGIPPLMLGSAGYEFARTDAGRQFGAAEMDGAKAGALVAGGYALLAVAGTLALSNEGPSPQLSETVLFMGVFYPVVFGGLGGYLSR